MAASGGIAPKLSDAELITLAVMQALLGYTSQARWLRHTDRHLRHLFPYLPDQSGDNKRLRRAAGLLRHAIRAIATDTALWTDNVWVADSTPVECGRSKETVKRSELAGWAQDGDCASTRAGVGAAVAPGVHPAWAAGLLRACRRQGSGPRDAAGHPRRRAAADAARPGQVLIADKHYDGREFEHVLAEEGLRLLRPARAGEPVRAGARLFKPLRQLIESVNDTFKGQLNLEQHGGHTPIGVAVRILQRILALTAAICHNHHTGQPTCGH